jgi:hypothetical protein
MRNLVLATILVAAPIALYAQSSAPDTLGLLLAEVRQLRIALEQSVTVAPRIQLLASRVAVQSDRTARAARDLDASRQEIAKIAEGISRDNARIQDLEGAAATETDPTRRQGFTLEARGLREAIRDQSIAEQRLRAHENELAIAYATEQGAWSDLNRRLDELERELGAARKPQ